MWGVFFHRIGIAANAEPRGPENNRSRQLRRNGRLRVNIQNLMISNLYAY